MSSQALYRKWRSQTFTELVGQEHVVQTLRNAIQSGRVGHAYLFTGPRGVGKTTMARLLAKAVNCEAPLPERPCDRCEMCRSIAEGRAVDVIEMDAASHTSVEDARELIERVQFRPTSARTKVYAIDEAHMLSTAAFNALLKTLEEPPEHALFILATTEFHKVPATIVSRCQRFVFTRHSVAGIRAHLMRIAAAENVALDEAAAERIARSATGSMRDAISVLDQLIAGGDGSVSLAQVQALLGAADTGTVGALVDALLANDVAAALHAIDRTADDGADLRQFTRDLVERLRALLLLAAGSDAATLEVPAETLEEMRQQAAGAPIDRLVAWLKLFSGLDVQLKSSPYGQLPLEIGVVEALQVAGAALAPSPRAVRPSQPAAVETQRREQASMWHEAQAEAPATRNARATPPIDRPAAPAAEPAVPEELLPPAPEPDDSREAPAPAVPAAAEIPAEIEVVDDAAFLLEDVQAAWEEIKADMLAEKRVLASLLNYFEPINVEGQVIVLHTGNEFHKSKLEKPGDRQRLEKVMSRVLGGPCTFRITLDESEQMPDVNKQIQHIKKDERVHNALNLFAAHIVQIERTDS